MINLLNPSSHSFSTSPYSEYKITKLHALEAVLESGACGEGEGAFKMTMPHILENEEMIRR